MIGPGILVAATGFRIVTAVNGTCIDEIELFAGNAPLSQLMPLEEGGEIDEGNLAATGNAFAKDVAGGRSVASLNDQTHGDDSAWVGESADSFAGINQDAILPGTKVLAKYNHCFGQDKARLTDSHLSCIGSCYDISGLGIVTSNFAGTVSCVA